MTTRKAGDQLTDTERQLNAQRCRICGKFHPFILVCPYIKATRTEQLRDAKNPNLRGRVTMTEYFHRPELMESALESLEEAEKELGD